MKVLKNRLILCLPGVLVLLLTACALVSADINVRDYGAAGNGVDDDQPEIQAALNAAEATGDRVYIPVGQYRIAGNLNVPTNVVLEGCLLSTQSILAPPGGSLILADIPPSSNDAASLTDTPLFTLGTGSTARSLKIYYPGQNDPSNVLPYPWTFNLTDRNMLENIILANSYNGVQAANRHLIRDVYGTALRRGVYVDACYDGGRIEEVQICWPYWCAIAGFGSEQTDALQQYLYANLEGFTFGRSDGEYVTGTCFFEAKIGYHFIETANGVCYGRFTLASIDLANKCIVIDGTTWPGLTFVNSDLIPFTGTNPLALLINNNANGYNGPVRLVNCSLWGPDLQQCVVSHNPTFTSLRNCLLSAGVGGTGRPTDLVAADAGRLQVVGCTFERGSKGTSIALQTGIVGANIVGNNGPRGVGISPKPTGSYFLYTSNEPSH